jgi:hypothetical protein
LVSSSSGAVVSSVLSTGLVIPGYGSSSTIESWDVVGFVFCHGLFFSDFVDQSWTLALELPLGHGCYLVHSLNGDGFLLLLCHHRSEFRRKCRLEKVHFEEVDPHGIVLSQEPPERVVGDSSVEIVVWVRNFGVVLIEALPDDSGGPGDAGEQFVCSFV